MTEPKFRYEVNGKMEAFTLSQIVYGYLPKDVLHPEHYRGQYIGLEDKHGNEVCSGDVVATYDDNGNIENNGKYALVILKHCCFHLYDDNERLRDISNGWGSCEIIGNIYENSNLLENVK